MNLQTFSAAYVRGCCERIGAPPLPEALRERLLSALSDAELAALDAIGREANLKMYYFKDHTQLPRVHKTLGFLRGVQPESLLDVGGGRGVPVTAVDLLERSVKFVRQSFLQIVEQSNSHWLERPIIPNELCRPVTELFQPTLNMQEEE